MTIITFPPTEKEALYVELTLFSRSLSFEYKHATVAVEFSERSFNSVFIFKSAWACAIQSSSTKRRNLESGIRKRKRNTESVKGGSKKNILAMTIKQDARGTNVHFRVVVVV